MPPKGASRPFAKVTPKRQKKVMTLEEKVQVLNKCREGMSFAAVGRLFHVNESTVRSMKRNEEAIRAAVNNCAPRSAKHVLQVRDKAIVKMEYALFLWMEDQYRKGEALNSNDIREKARYLYDHFKASTRAEESGPSTSTTSPTTLFQASKGWLANFKRRFSVDVKLTSVEATLADNMAARSFPAELEATVEKGYKPGPEWYTNEIGWSLLNVIYIEDNAEANITKTKINRMN